MKRHRSALKRARQAEKRRKSNMVYRSRIKTFTKRVNEELKKDDKEKTGKALRQLISTLDKAAQKGIIHKNTAGRKKSRMSKKVNVLLTEARTTASLEVQESRGGISSPVI